MITWSDLPPITKDRFKESTLAWDYIRHAYNQSNWSDSSQSDWEQCHEGEVFKACQKAWDSKGEEAQRQFLQDELATMQEAANDLKSVLK